jgi:endoglucanase
MLSSMMDASGVLVGWQWWAAGPAWGNYPFSLHPKDGQDRPQMSLLVPWLTAQ